MLTPQFLLPIADELVCDLFAGGGGASTGIEQAIGRPVDIAVNHDPEAVSLHTANHPQTRHFTCDVFEVDPRTVTDGRPVGLLWASPDCTFHSKARGGKPFRDRNRARRRRGLAWVVCRWAREVRPRVIALENVEEFQKWGPLAHDGTPCPDRAGLTFRRWVAQLRNLGYAVEWLELRACDYGAPTIRKRLFIIARCDGQPIVWPKPTHGKPDTLPVKANKLKAWRTAAECIDWSIPCPSIFERKKPLADATLRRVAKGVMRYVVDAAEPFIVTNTTGHPGARASEPLRTITTGGHHALVTAFLAKHYTGVVGSELRDPIGTITAWDHHSLVTTHLEPFYESIGRIEGANIRRYSGRKTRRNDLETSHPQSFAANNADNPKTGGDSVKKWLSNGEDGVAWQGVLGIGACGGVRTAEWANSMRNGHQPSGREQGQQPSEQLGNVQSLGEPSPRIQDRSAKTKNYPNCRQPISGSQGIDGASNEFSANWGEAWNITNDRISRGQLVAAFITKYYGNEQDGVPLTEPMHTIPTRDRFGLVTVQGEDYAIVDIGLRMLTPRELYRAQGFPNSYRIEHGAAGEPLTKTAQVRMCGNSVCPQLALAVVAANYCDQSTERMAA